MYNEGGSAKIGNAYTLLAASDSKDPGLQVGIKILKQAFKVFIDVGAVGAGADAPDPIVGKGGRSSTA